MNPEQIQKGLRTKTLGRSLLCLEKTTSTNDVVSEMARQGAPEGTVILSETQTKGRGRLGRRWATTEGKSLAFSVLLRSRLHADELPEITLAAAVAVAKALEDFHFKPRIKWPNDLLLGGRKVCGILTETAFKREKMTTVILGVGINLNQNLQDFPKELRETATSCFLVSGRKTDRVHFFQKLMFRLEEAYHLVVERHFSKVLQEWRKRNAIQGRQVKVTQGHQHFYGQAVDADEKGALLVRNDVGMVERVTAGDVQILLI
jgi:BirA family biotin operon repressor/biotin-[acetyl-CoA-carboxylase] ligase